MNISLNQGELFNKYKQKINIGYGSSDVLEGFDNLTEKSRKVLRETKIDEKRYNILKNEYDNLIDEIENINKSTLDKREAYIKRTSIQSNKYLNKNIKIGKGIFYVNNLGIARWYPNSTIWNNNAGKNGCPSQNEILDTGLAWSGKYTKPGVTIPTDPPLVSGNHITYDQGCNYVGQNVYVGELLTDEEKTDNYIGVYNNNNYMNWIWSWWGGSQYPPGEIIIANANVTCPTMTKNTFWYLPKDYNLCGLYNAGETGVVVLNNSTAWRYPMPYPTGDQCICIQNYKSGVGKLGLLGASGNGQIQLDTNEQYTLGFYMCGRPSGNGSNPLKVGIARNGDDSIQWIYTTENGEFIINPVKNEWTYFETIPFSVNPDIWTSGLFYLLLEGQGTGGDYGTALCGFKLIKGSSSGGKWTSDQCKQASITQGYKYFGLTNYDANTDAGYCGLTNDKVAIDVAGNATVPTKKVVLWSANNGNLQDASFAKLEYSGQISIYNTSNAVIWQSGLSSTANDLSSYYGTYGDNSSRMMPTYVSGWYNAESCKQEANDQGMSYFGLQYMQSNKLSQCFVTNDITKARSLGKRTNAGSGGPNGTQPYGGGWSNSIYGAGGPGFDCFLIAQDDGNLVIYRGVGPSDNQGFIWASGTNGKPKESNPLYKSENGLNGINFMIQNQILSQGDFLSNNSGNLVLEWNNGQLELVTFEMGPNQIKTKEDKWAGGTNATAIYELNAQSNPSLLGKAAWINSQNSPRAYKNGDLKFKNTYNEIPNTNWEAASSSNIDELTLSLDECKDKCNSMDNCSGFVTIPEQNKCILKNETVKPYNNLQALSQNETVMNTYQRQKEPKITPDGIPDGSVMITTTEFDILNNHKQNVINLDMGKKYGMAALTSVNKSKLKNLQSRLNLLANELGLNTETYDLNSKNVIKRMVENADETDRQSDEFFNIKKEINYLTKDLPNQERIIDETDIAALKEIYNYTIWSIVAIGIIIGLLIITKKNK
jgi:hypothetical protein